MSLFSDQFDSTFEDLSCTSEKTDLIFNSRKFYEDGHDSAFSIESSNSKQNLITQLQNALNTSAANLREFQSKLASEINKTERAIAEKENRENEVMQLKMALRTSNCKINENVELIKQLNDLVNELRIMGSTLERNCRLSEEQFTKTLKESKNKLAQQGEENNKLMMQYEEMLNDKINISTDLSQAKSSIQQLEDELISVKISLEKADTELKNANEKIVLREDKEVKIKILETEMIKVQREHASKTRNSVEQAVREVMTLVRTQLENSEHRLESAENALAKQTHRLKNALRTSLADDNSRQQQSADKKCCSQIEKPVVTGSKENLFCPLILNTNMSMKRLTDDIPNEETGITQTTDAEDKEHFLREKLTEARRHAHQLEVNQRWIYTQLSMIPGGCRKTRTSHLSVKRSRKLTNSKISEATKPINNANCATDLGDLVKRVFDYHSTLELDLQKALMKLNSAQEKITKLEIFAQEKRANEKIERSSAPKATDSKGCWSRLHQAESRAAKADAEAEHLRRVCECKDVLMEAERNRCQTIVAGQHDAVLIRDNFLLTIYQLLKTTVQQVESTQSVLPPLPNKLSVMESAPGANGDTNANCSKQNVVEAKSEHCVIRRRRKLQSRAQDGSDETPRRLVSSERPSNIDAYSRRLFAENKMTNIQSQLTRLLGDDQKRPEEVSVSAQNTSEQTTQWDTLSKETSHLLTNLIVKVTQQTCEQALDRKSNYARENLRNLQHKLSTFEEGLKSPNCTSLSQSVGRDSMERPTVALKTDCCVVTPYESDNFKKKQSRLEKNSFMNGDAASKTQSDYQEVLLTLKSLVTSSCSNSGISAGCRRTTQTSATENEIATVLSKRNKFGIRSSECHAPEGSGDVDGEGDDNSLSASSYFQFLPHSCSRKSSNGSFCCCCCSCEPINTNMSLPLRERKLIKGASLHDCCYHCCCGHF